MSSQPQFEPGARITSHCLGFPVYGTVKETHDDGTTTIAVIQPVLCDIQTHCAKFRKSGRKMVSVDLLWEPDWDITGCTVRVKTSTLVEYDEQMRKYFYQKFDKGCAL